MHSEPFFLPSRTRAQRLLCPLWSTGLAQTNSFTYFLKSHLFGSAGLCFEIFNIFEISRDDVLVNFPPRHLQGEKWDHEIKEISFAVQSLSVFSCCNVQIIPVLPVIPGSHSYMGGDRKHLKCHRAFLIVFHSII